MHKKYSKFITAKGFSLVEITMALGIISVAFVALMGVLPTGLKSFRDSIDRSVTAQIVQRLVNEARQTDFEVLLSIQGSSKFTDQGDLTSEDSNTLYVAETQVVKSLQIPTSDEAFMNQNLAQVRIRISKNPGSSLEPNSVIPLQDISVYVPKM